MLRSVRLQDFRNYERLVLELRPGINVVIGGNGRGKTNLLEALFLLLQGRSMRGSDAGEMVKRGREAVVVEGVIDLGREVKVRVSVASDGSLRGKGTREGMGAVCFQPDDIWMLKGGPEARRKSLDEVVAGLKRGYRETLKDYQRVLRQRNEAIRMVGKRGAEREYMRSWNPLLCELGCAVAAERIKVLSKLGEELARLGEEWGKGKIVARYYTTMGDDVTDAEKVMLKVRKMEEAEVGRGVTLIGPHRDELLFLLEGRNLRRECSQGEQKLAAIMWRLAQGRLLEKEAGRKVLLLMDDALSELDRENRRLLVGELGRWEQAVATTTDELAELSGLNAIRLDEEVVGKGSRR